jgi:hypothetical protein
MVEEGDDVEKLEERTKTYWISAKAAMLSEC